MKVNLTYVSDTESIVGDPDEVESIAGICCKNISLEVLGLEQWGDIEVDNFDGDLVSSAGVTLNSFSFEVDPDRAVFNLKICPDMSADSKVRVKLDGVVFAEVYLSAIVQFVASPITANMPALNFGFVLKGNTLTLPVTITNNSAEDIELDPGISGLCTGLSMVDGGNFVLGAGESIQFFVEWHPVSEPINLACTLTFAEAGADPACNLLQVPIKGKSFDACDPDIKEVSPSFCCEDLEGNVTDITENPSECNPFILLNLAFANFYSCAHDNLIADVNKLKSTGIFGLFDKSKKAANDINDMHYLALLLFIMWQEKVEDALAGCNCCRISKHPKYYIDKYNLQCVYEYFKCKNIDILCHLKGFGVDKVFGFYKYYVNSDTTDSISDDGVTNKWSFRIVPMYPEQFDNCTPPDPTKDVCCTIAGNGTYASDWLYNAIRNYEDCVDEAECDYPHTFNLDEVADMYTWNLGEDYNCGKTYTFNLNEKPC